MFISFGNVSIAVIHLAIGFVAGAFAPAVGRKIKALWVKQTQAFAKIVYSDYDKVKSDVKAEAEKIVSKL